MGIARRKLVVTSVVFAITVTVLAPNVSATSAEPDSRAQFFESYRSLADYAKSNGRDARAWMPETRISKKEWASALNDESIRVDTMGRAFVVEPAHSEFDPNHASPQSATPVSDIPLTDAFLLASLPGANRTIYLDFTGHSLAGTYWQLNDEYVNGVLVDGPDYTNSQMLMPPYSDDGDTTTFSSVERQNIIDTWSAVAEDYAPFAVNVTTVEPAQSALDRTNSSDQIYGVRAVITDNTNAIATDCGCGGIAYLDVFDYVYWNTYLGPSLSFAVPGRGGKFLSDIVSHEVGHNLGLYHDGGINPPSTSMDGYYEGRDGWAPIMGVGYYEPLVQFSNGTYDSANEFVDDYLEMSGNGLPLRADDHGDTRATATALALGTEDEGFITTREDVDFFSFVASAASHDITVTLPSVSPNLDVQLKLFNASGTLISITNPNFFRSSTNVATGLDVSLTATTTPGSTYYLEVDGVGFGPGTTTGYSDYGSRGEYRVFVPLATLASIGTPIISGTGAVGTTLTGSTGTWPSGVTFTTQWIRNGSSAGDTDSSYSITGSDLGREMTFRVVASKSGYTSVTANSGGVTVTAGTISPTATPKISGTATVKKTLTARTRGWMPSVTFSYQWLRNGAPIVGATSSKYKLKTADKRKRVSVQVTATRSGYNPVTLTSGQTRAVKR